MNTFELFPSRTLAFYTAKLFLLRSAAVLAALVLVLQALDLLGESGKILAVPGNGDGELWRYMSLRAPQIVSRFLPFSVLLGTLITLAGLNQNSEVISMKAAGVSAHQIIAPLIMTSFLVAGLSFWFNDHVVARATTVLDAWQAVDYGPLPTSRNVASNVWVRDGDDLVHAEQAQGRGAAARLTGVSVYDREGGKLRSIVTAASAIPADGGWRLHDARGFDIERGAVTKLGTPIVARGVTADQFTLAEVKPEEKSFRALKAAIEDLRDAGRPTGALEAGLWHKLSGPLSAVLMPLLAAVAAFGLARSGRLFVRAVIGMALGFTYFVADNAALAMGNLGAYPPLLAAWAPFFLFFLIGEAVLIRTEE
jgi:lipopolysaccharide export system permease protein